MHWWHVHRLHQRDGIPETVLRSPRPSHDSIVAPLVDAVADLYAYVYAVPGTTVREAARLRVAAMGRSDAWVAAGCSFAARAIDTAGVAGYRRVSASRQVRPD